MGLYTNHDTVTWYASYSESFIPKSGGQYADLKNSTKNGKIINKTDLDSDVYENTEFGVKFDTDYGISITASYYELTSVKPEFVDVGVLEVMEKTYEGYEFQAIGNVSENWYINAGASIVNNADNLDEVPGRTLSLWNLYQFNNKLSFGLGIINKGSTKGKGSVDLPSYSRIDAAAYYKIDDDLRLQLNIENITDELYYPHSYGTHQVSVGAPVHATVKLVGRF